MGTPPAGRQALLERLRVDGMDAPGYVLRLVAAYVAADPARAVPSLDAALGVLEKGGEFTEAAGLVGLAADPADREHFAGDLATAWGAVRPAEAAAWASPAKSGPAIPFSWTIWMSG